MFTSALSLDATEDKLGFPSSTSSSVDKAAVAEGDRESLRPLHALGVRRYHWDGLRPSWCRRIACPEYCQDGRVRGQVATADHDKL